MKSHSVASCESEDEDAFYWDAIETTFWVMEKRRMERKFYGRVSSGVSRPIVYVLIFMCVVQFAVQVLVAGSIPGYLKVKADSECTDVVTYETVKTSGQFAASDALKCGELVSRTRDCSHVFMWPKANNSEGCNCCKYSAGQTVHDVIDQNTRENPASDLYLVWYTDNIERDLTLFSTPRFWAYTFAVIAGVLTAFIFVYSVICSDEGMSWRGQVLCVTIVFGCWMTGAQMEPRPNTLLWDHRDIGWAPTVQMFNIFVSYVSVIVVLFLSDCLSRRLGGILVNCCRAWNIQSWWYFLKVERSPELGPWMKRCPSSPGGYSLRLTCSYRPHGWLKCFTPRQQFTYSGGCNQIGQPHGHGVWHEESHYGENLEGYFVEGKLDGPFTSRVVGSGVVIMQRATAYVASRTDCPRGQLSSMSCCGAQGPPRCGIAQLECSVAGGFYPFYPRVNSEIDDSIAEDDISGMLNFYLTDGTCKESVQASQASPQQEQEALVFVHGFMCELSTALQKLALVTMLGKMPSHIVPIVFGWSSGHVPQFFYLKNYSHGYAEDFCSFFAELGVHFKKVHVFCHSMGCHVWCKNFPSIASRCFIKVDAQARIRSFTPKLLGDTRMQLENLILLNAELTVDEMMDCSAAMADYAKLVTLYVDRTDIANLTSQVVQSIMPSSWQHGWRYPENVQRTVIVGRELSDYHIKCEADGVFIAGKAVSEAYGESEEDEEAPMAPQCLKGSLMDKIEVIDCTSLDYNAGFSRHNYYAINSLMVEDISELVGRCHPAMERAHLVKRDHGIFDFLAAPQIVTM